MKKALLILLCCLLLSACGKVAEEAPELLEAAGAQPDTAVAAREDIVTQNVYKAVFAPRYTSLWYDHDAVIGEMNVSIGSVVKAGDTILSKDVSSVNAQLAALDSEESALLRDEESEKELYDIDMELYDLYIKKAPEDEKYSIETEKEIYALEFANAQSERSERLAAIASQRALLLSQLEGISLISPVNGRISYIGARSGGFLSAYETACIVTDEDSVVLQSDFISQSALENATSIYALCAGERVEITPEAIDEDEYARAALKGRATYSVFTFEGDHAIGATAVVVVERVLAENVIAVPVNAVLSENGEYYVYAYADGNRTRVSVTVGEKNASLIEITSGLSEGSVVYVGD